MRQTRTLIFASVAVIFALGFVTTRTKANDPDPVLESFQRVLNHEPLPVPRANRDEILDDELYRALNSIHWTRDDEEPVETEESNEKSTDAPADR